jgi:hypothetical protein
VEPAEKAAEENEDEDPAEKAAEGKEEYDIEKEGDASRHHM